MRYFLTTLECKHGNSSGSAYDTIANLWPSSSVGSRRGTGSTEGRCDDVGGGCYIGRIGVLGHLIADLPCEAYSFYGCRLAVKTSRGPMTLGWGIYGGLGLTAALIALTL